MSRGGTPLFFPDKTGRSQASNQLWHTWDSKAQKSGEHGTVFWPNGERFKGEFSNNTMQGMGTYYYKNGDKYEGGWERNKRSGQGMLLLADGDKYRVRYNGEWKEGLMWGFGVLYEENGDRYEGDFLNDLRHGNGRQTYNSSNTDGSGGDVYDGEWKHGKRCGKGTLTLSNRDSYSGMWENDLKHGEGSYFYEVKEKRYDGVWEAGIPKCGAYTDIEPRLVSRIPALGLAQAEEVLRREMKHAIKVGEAHLVRA